MTSKQESQLGMFTDVSAQIMKFPEVTGTLPDFEITFNEFGQNITGIEKIANLQSFDKTGYAKEKKQLRNVVEMLTLDNSLKLEAYGMVKSNIILTKEVSFSKSRLRKAKDNILAVFAQMIYDKAQENLEGLGAYGITQETQSVLLNTINAYKASVGKPRLGQKDKKEATRQLSELFTRQEALLEKMDALINIIRLKNPDFYNRYRELRKVVIPGGGSLSMKATAIEIPAGIPLKGVRFEFIPGRLGTVPSNAVFVKKTANKGSIYVKNIPEGPYKLKVTKTGYMEKELAINIITGEMLDLKVELEKS